MPAPSTSAIPAETLRLYQEAIYSIDLPATLPAALPASPDLPSGHLPLRIGHPEPRLLPLLAPFPGCGAALITAWNPEGVLLSQIENERLAADLHAHVTSLGHPIFPAGGSAPDWSFHEPGLAIFGLTAQAAAHLGRTWRQNAIVWIPPTATPELLLLR